MAANDCERFEGADGGHERLGLLSLGVRVRPPVDDASDSLKRLGGSVSIGRPIFHQKRSTQPTFFTRVVRHQR